MNIDLKLKKSQLDSFIEILQDQQITNPVKIADKCMFYLYSSALKKLLKKQIDKADDFSNKPYKISLKYEEATAVYLELTKIKDSYGTYENNLILTILNELRKKLH